MPLRALTGAFEAAARCSALISKGGIYRARQIEPSVAVRIRARKLKECPRGRMQHVRLGRWRVRRQTLERQLETQLLKIRICDPKRMRPRALAT